MHSTNIITSDGKVLDGLTRHANGAIINTDRDAYTAHKAKMNSALKEKQELDQMKQDITALKDTMAEILSIMRTK